MSKDTLHISFELSAPVEPSKTWRLWLVMQSKKRQPVRTSIWTGRQPATVESRPLQTAVSIAVGTLKLAYMHSETELVIDEIIYTVYSMPYRNLRRTDDTNDISCK